MSATPRTDSMAKPAKQYVCECVPARFARQLEMENGELREACQAFVEWCDGDHWPAKRPNPPTLAANMARTALARSGKGGA